MKFLASEGATFSDGDAELLAHEIDTLRVRMRVKKLKPRHIVDAARTSASPLHPYFEWDDRLAAEAYRIEQAKYIVRHIHVAEDDNEGDDPERPSVRYYHSVKDEEDDGPGYAPLTIIVREPDYHQQMVTYALEELRGWTKRYATYTDLAYLAEIIAANLPEG